MPTYNPGSEFVQTSDFGPRNLEGGFHYGVDFKAPIGTPIPAASSGEVWYSGFQNPNNLGHVVVIKSVGANGQDYFTLYAHMNGEDMPTRGQLIDQGDMVGRLGNTGRSTGPHVHVEVLDGSAPIRNADGGPLGVYTKDYATDPAEFDNWADDNQPYGSEEPIQTGQGGKGPVTFFDANGELIAGTTFVYQGSDAIVTVEYVDANGQPLVDPKISLNFDSQLINSEQLGTIFGSQLGQILLDDGNIFARIGAATLGATIVGNIGEFAQSLLSDLDDVPGYSALDVAVQGTFGDIDAELIANVQGQTANVLSTLVLAEAAEALGLEGFEGQVFTSLGGLITGQLTNNLINAGTALDTAELLNGISQLNITTGLATAGGGVLGSYLSSQVIDIDSLAEGLVSSSAGAYGGLSGGSIGANDNHKKLCPKIAA